MIPSLPSQRVLAPPPHRVKPGDHPLPVPSEGSAVSQVFRAFESEGTGLMGASALPRALRLLEIDSELPEVKRTLDAAARSAKGLFDRCRMTKPCARAGTEGLVGGGSCQSFTKPSGRVHLFRPLLNGGRGVFAP